MSSNAATRVLIVDDHAMVRLALSEAIGRHNDLKLVGEAENGAQALDLCRKLRPDVITMDYRLPDRDGDEVIAAIKAEFSDIRIMLLSIFENEECLHRATLAGALGCVSKGAEIDEVIIGIRAASRGEAYFSEGLAEKLDERRKREDLSPRELDVLTQLVAGLSNKEISSALHMAGSTVKHHLERISAKLGTQDRTQAVTAAVQRGIVRLDER